MSTISLRLPESLHAQARQLAEQEGISINQLIATSLAEKVSALLTHEYLEARAARGSRAAFLRVLKKVKDRPPVPGDER
jgi:predicted DNA-binding ribbon-helix-helix protein